MTVTALPARRTAAAATVSLSAGGPLLRIEHPAGHAIGCLSGRVWITQGDARDVILQPGDSIVIAGDALVLVSALGGPARVTSIAKWSLAHAA